MTELCFQIEEQKVKGRGRYQGTVSLRYRAVYYRASLNFDGVPVYLRKGHGRWYRNRWDARYEAEKTLLGHPFMRLAESIRLYDAADGMPITEGDVLKFMPEVTHPMAALDKLRDILQGDLV